jgi:hypothetical protein
MAHLFNDQLAKLYAHFKVNMDMHRGGVELDPDFTLEVLKILLSAQENLDVTVQNFRRLGAGENPAIAAEMDFIDIQIIPEIIRTVTELKSLSGIDPAQWPQFDIEAHKVRSVGVETMEFELPDADFPLK